MTTLPSEKLFQYAVWYRDPKGDTEKDELITSVETVQAVDARHVERIAMRALEAKWDDKLANITVDVRPF